MDQLRQVVIIRFVLAMQSVMKVFSVWYLIKSGHPMFLCWFCDLWCDPTFASIVSWTCCMACRAFKRELIVYDFFWTNCSRCIERVFGLAQWRDLLGKLTIWKV
jgi:hypothetical protein